MFLLQANMNGKVGVVENTQHKNVSTTPTIPHSMEPQRTTMNMSTLSLKTLNKCCPQYQHYIEDDYRRLMCGNVSTVFNAISIGNEGFQFLQQYSCETAFGMYVNNFEKLDVNGLGYVTYKKKIYPRSCIDYDTKKQRWIIMECTMGRHVTRTTVKLKQIPITTTIGQLMTGGLKNEGKNISTTPTEGAASTPEPLTEIFRKL